MGVVLTFVDVLWGGERHFVAVEKYVYTAPGCLHRTLSETYCTGNGL